MIKPELIKFTKHARHQMGARNISEDEVVMTLTEPDEILPGKWGDEVIAIKYYNNKRCREIYVSEPEEIRVITVTH